MPGQSGRRGPVRKNAARPTEEFGQPGGRTCSELHEGILEVNLSREALMNERWVKSSSVSIGWKHGPGSLGFGTES